MTTIKIAPLIIALTPLLTHAAAPAIINGDVELTVNAGSITNSALGNSSIAQVVLGSVLEAEVTGGFKTTVVVNDIVNSADANGSCSQVVIGSIGVLNCGNE